MRDDHEYIHITCGHCGETINVPVYCKNRFCPECGKTRLKRIRHKIKNMLELYDQHRGYTYKHLTLTIKNQTDLKPMVDFLIAAFRRLRQRSIWKKNVKAGAFVIEVTRSEAGWHAHIHSIISAKYIPWKQLRDVWEAVSGGTGLYIQRMPQKQIVQYLTKYITKTELPIDQQVLASSALSGKRLFNPFGEWHKLSSAIKSPIGVCSKCGWHAWEYGTPQDVARRYFPDYRKGRRIKGWDLDEDIPEVSNDLHSCYNASNYGTQSSLSY